MKLLKFIFILILNSWNINCNQGFVALFAPKNIITGKNLTVTVYSKDIPDGIKVFFDYHDSTSHAYIEDGEYATFELDNSKTFNIRKNRELKMILYQETSSNKGMCSTKSVQLIPEARKFYIFIQTDKPVYKPGDVVKFRVLVIDRDMKPFHMNNIKVEFIDPVDNGIITFEDLEHQYLGIFENTFKLSESTILGNWNIKVTVDRCTDYPTVKTFEVQKYILPLFEVIVDIADKNLLVEDDLIISFNAKYSFGEPVEGRAELTIKDLQTDKIYLSKAFDDIKDAQILNYNLTRDLKINPRDQMILQLMVKFTETESQITFNKTANFYVHKYPKYKIFPIHQTFFQPGSKFNIKVLVNDYKDQPVIDNIQDVELKYSYTVLNNRRKMLRPKTVDLRIRDGIAKYEISLPKTCKDLHVEIKFSNSDMYKKTIKAGNAAEVVNEIFVASTTERIEVNKNVVIYAERESEIDKIFYIITTVNGNIKSDSADCGNEKFCEFSFKLTEDMTPHFTVTVYHVEAKNKIFQGSVQLRTKSLKGYNLKVNLSTEKAKTKEIIKMDFTSLTNSTIYLLAYDKRLKFLKDGNDITADDVTTAISSYETQNQIIIDDLSSWHKCTKDESKLIEDEKDEMNYDFDLRFGFSEEEEDQDENEVEVPNLRKEFPETWIFDTFETNKRKSISKEYVAPDSITTWLISAFSLNKDRGLAIAETQELRVMNDFFVKMNLPYSIKFKEVLKLDILIYNYVDTKEQLDVNVELENPLGHEFEFVEYTKVRGSCTVAFNRNQNATKTTSVPYLGVKKVSFHIRPNLVTTGNANHENVPRQINLNVKATGIGRSRIEYKDLVLKKLIVEPIGVRIYSVFTEDYILNGGKSNHHTYSANFTDGLAGVTAIVGGDYLGNMVDMNSRFEIYPSHCLEQRTSIIKGNVEYFRYLLTKTKNPDKKYFSNYYQQLLVSRTKAWNYRTKSGYRSYFLEAIASAMEIGAIPKNDKIITKELDELKKKQNPNGSFKDFGSFPAFKTRKNLNTDEYFETAYVLIPFLKLRKSFKRYEKVIKNAFNFLNSSEKKHSATLRGCAIAAYAYALDNNRIAAKELLDKLEDAYIAYPNNRKCFKISRASLKCSLRHTSYAALAYLTIGEISEATKLVHWLLKDMQLKFFHLNTHEYAVATEPVAKLAAILKVPKTDFTVTLRNERNFSAALRIKATNKNQMQFIEIPEYSHDVSYAAEGHGYCSVTVLYEQLIAIRRVSTSFSVNVNFIVTPRKKYESKVKICARQTDEFAITLFNVIYEIEMPSGYVYSEVVDIQRKQNQIKLVETKKKNTLVYIYYNDFEPKKEYCVEMIVKKTFDVKDIKPAGVKVYDYNDKTNVAVEFFLPKNPEC